MGKPFTVSADKVSSFDPSAVRVTDLGNNATSSESGCYVGGDIAGSVARSTTAMPEPLPKSKS